MSDAQGSGGGPSNVAAVPEDVMVDPSVWCENGHDPKIPDKVDGIYVCRHCGRELDVRVTVEVLSR